MISLVLKNSFELYKQNYKVAMSYLLLLIFFFLFDLLNEFFINSGTVFFSFNLTIISLIGAVIMLVFLYTLSFFVSTTIFAVERDVQKLSFDDYWKLLFSKSSINIFSFYILTSLAFFILLSFSVGTIFSIPSLIICLVLSAVLMYVPQSIVLDEKGISGAVSNSVRFFFSNFIFSVLLLIVFSIILFLVFLFEFIFSFVFIFEFLTIIFILIFVMPFFEFSKSYAYYLKYDLIKGHEVQKSKFKPKIKKIKKLGVRLREMPPQGKL